MEITLSETTTPPTFMTRPKIVRSEGRDATDLTVDLFEKFSQVDITLDLYKTFSRANLALY